MVKVLLVSTVPALSSYAIGVINAAFKSKELECHAFVFLAHDNLHHMESLKIQYGIPKSENHRFTVHRLAKNKVLRILSSGKYLKQVAGFAHRHGIQKIHFLTQDVMLHGHLHLFKDFELYYTVHDVIAHPTKLGLFHRIKHYFLRIRKDRLLTAKINHLITNSTSQENLLKERYPNKNIFFHRMPDLVTRTIMDGNRKVKELTSIKDYVLFFGRIEAYKGVDELYHAFVTMEKLKGIPLVVAGNGNIYFKRDLQKEDHITFINRYIADEEMNDLFDKAIMLVLPYRSATQSAVTSLAYHYNLPVLASAIDALRDTIVHEETGLLYEPGNLDEMGEAILKLIANKALYESIRLNLKNKNTVFNSTCLCDELELIYG